MPIRHFDYYISEKQLIQTAPISQLKGAKIGFEGQYWLRKIIKPLNIARMSNSAEAKTLENITANIVAMGGTFPYNSFKTLLEKEINKIRSLDIYPFFVFNGLSFLRKDKPFSIEDTRPNKRASGWDHYERGRLESAYNTWSSSSSVHQNEFMNSVFKIFQENNIEFMRAPYSSWAQLAYLQQKGYIQSVYSGSEMLMWCGDTDNVILNIDFDKKEFTWVEKIRVIQDLHLINPDHFIDICMLAGFDWISTFPPLVNNTAFTFKGTVDMLQQHKTGYNAIQAYAEHPNVKKHNYEENFCRIKSIINHNIILKEDGTTEPLNKETAPNDLHELFGPRLPDEVYFYMCQGMVSPQVITNLVSGVLLEGPPLCNGDTIEYREFIKSQSLLDLRTQALSLLTMGMSHYMRNRRVNSIFWFEPSHEVQLHHGSEAIGARWLPPNKIAQLNDSKQSSEKDNENEEENSEEGKEKEKSNSAPESVKVNSPPVYSLSNNIEWIESHKKKDKDFSIANINLLFCLQTIANQSQIQLNVPTNQNVNNSKNSKGNNALSPFDLKYVRSVDDIYGLVLLRFLEARDFVKLSIPKSNPSATYTIGSYQVTPYGKALQKALNASPSSHIFQEEIITAFELIRMNALTNKSYNRIPYMKPGTKLSSPVTLSTPSTPNKEGNDIKEHINLISRVASLLHISFKSMVVWKGPLDLELLRFNSFMKAVTRSLRNLCEMILLSMTMNENAGKSDSNLEVLSAGIKLPFLLDANTANGIITKTYLDSLTDIINITPEVIQKSTTTVENRFQEYCDDVKTDMENTYKLWDCVLEGVKSLKSDGQISEEYAKEFIDADEWLKGKRPLFN